MFTGFLPRVPYFTRMSRVNSGVSNFIFLDKANVSSKIEYSLIAQRILQLIKQYPCKKKQESAQASLSLFHLHGLAIKSLIKKRRL